jgi:hypothetical protein
MGPKAIVCWVPPVGTVCVVKLNVAEVALPVVLVATTFQ